MFTVIIFIPSLRVQLRT